MKRSIILITALLLAVVQGAWAQTVISVSVTNADDLATAVKTNNADIVLGADIQLESYLNIDGNTVTIDLNGHKLYRSISGDYSSTGHVIYLQHAAKLTLFNSQ